MRIVDNYRIKKVYHFLKENNVKGRSLLFIFYGENDERMFEPVKKWIIENYPKIKIGTIQVVDVNKDVLKDYNIIFNMPEIFDLNAFNNECCGIPNMEFKVKHSILEHYRLDKYVIIHMTSKYDLPDYIDLIYNIYNIGIKCILTGNKKGCIDLTNKVVEDLIILNDNLLDSIIMKNCLMEIRQDEFVSDGCYRTVEKLKGIFDGHI